ncbi:MAG: hypothetical protein KC468_34625, partial [Myxococcales bacterium]|nr:hypothetical protein [Myxococcales bacterium]
LLVEDDISSLNLRLLLPIPPTRATGAAALEESAALAVAAQTLALELERRARRYQGRVELVQKPGRFELAMQTQTRHFERAMPMVGALLGRPSSPRTLELGRRYLEGGAPALAPEARAINELSGRLLGLDPGSMRVEPERVAALEEDALRRAWDQLCDPRAAVLVVHTGLASGTPGVTEGLNALSTSWRARVGEDRGATREDREDDAHGRLVATAATGTRGGFLLGERVTSVTLVEMPGQSRPELLFGRVVPTPTSRDRSMARLAQRVLQEALDVRLTIAGDRALFMVRAPVRAGREQEGGEDPTGAKQLLDAIRGADKKGDDPQPTSQLARAVERFQRLSQRRETAQRLFQAAQLWLGARMVAASLTGEDWTALWSDAIDLSTKDADIAGALARDAREMLATTPDELLAWQKRWLDPAAGEPGWQWVVAGDPDVVAPALAKLGVEITRVKPS